MRRIIFVLCFIGCLLVPGGIFAQEGDVSQYFADGLYESKHHVGIDFGQLINGDLAFRYEYMFGKHFAIEAGAGVLLGYGRLPVLGPRNDEGMWFDRDGGYSLYVSPRFKIVPGTIYSNRGWDFWDPQFVYGLVFHHRASNGVVMYGVPNLQFQETSYMAYGGSEFRLGKAIALETGLAIGATSGSGNAMDILADNNGSTGTTDFDFNLSFKLLYLIK